MAYLRTSSATNVGADKDSSKRQREAIERYARGNGFRIADDDFFYDADVSGADALGDRAGFSALLERIAGNGVRVVIVEDASRFARELMVQEAGIRDLVGLGVRVLTATGEDLTASDDPSRVMIRQMLGAFAEYERSRLVGKLRNARDRKRAETGRCEGRRPLAETNPEAVRLAKRLRRASPRTGERRSLREIAALLADAGHLGSKGQPFAAQSVKNMLAQSLPSGAPDDDQ